MSISEKTTVLPLHKDDTPPIHNDNAIPVHKNSAPPVHNNNTSPVHNDDKPPVDDESKEAQCKSLLRFYIGYMLVCLLIMVIIAICSGNYLVCGIIAVYPVG